MISGQPFRLDEFHGFANVRERHGSGEADPECFIVADKHGYRVAFVVPPGL